MPRAKSSNRSTSLVTLSFGMATFPLNLYSGVVSDHGIDRKQFVPVPVMVKDAEGKDTDVQATVDVPVFDADGAQVFNDDGEPVVETVLQFRDDPVGNKPYNKATFDDVSKDSIIKKVATDYGFVPVTDAEIERLFEITPKSMQIRAFQPLALFRTGHYVPRTLYYTVPAKITVGSRKAENKDLNRAYATLLEAMRKKGAMALVELTGRGLPRPAVLLPDATLWVLYFTDELRAQNPLPEAEPVASDVTAAARYLEMFWDDNEIDVSDKRSELIQTFADEKAQAGNFAAPVEVEVAEPEVSSSGFNFGALIQASIDAKAAEQTAEEAS